MSRSEREVEVDENRRDEDEPEHLDLTKSSLGSSLVSNEESSLVEPHDGSTSDEPTERGEGIERSEVVGSRKEEEDRSEHSSSGGEHHLGTGIVLVHQVDVVLVEDLGRRETKEVSSKSRLVSRLSSLLSNHLDNSRS